MPEEGDPFTRNPELLTYEEIAEVVGIFGAQGVRKIRLTGGEPLVRRDLARLVALLKEQPGIEHVALTTNAFLLARQAEALREAGLDSLNISIDSLDPERFARLTRTGTLDRVLEGIEAASEQGFESVKLNAVVVRGFNDDEIPALVRFAHDHGAIMRFIEFMPIGQDTIWGGDGRSTCVPAREIRDLLREHWRLEPDATRYGAGPARYWRCHGEGAPEQGIKVGVIGAVTECFCEDCNRVRVTSRGGLRACLADDGEVDLREILRNGGTPQERAHELRAAIWRSLWGKKARHAFELDGTGVTHKAMNAIGG